MNLTIVRDFQAVISKEIKEQILEKEGKLPKAVMACVGGGSNAMGMFYNFINDKNVRLIGCEEKARMWYSKPDQFRAKILNYYKGDREQWMQK